MISWIPRDNGVTSSNTISLTFPVKIAPWIAAPMATASSGLTPLEGGRPKKLVTVSYTLGIRVIPPTSNTSWIWSLATSESDKHFLRGRMDLSIISLDMSSNSLLVIVISKCIGPEEPTCK